MRNLNKGQKQLLVYCAVLVVVMFAACVAFLVDGYNLAWEIAMFGTFGVIVITYLYVILIDSKKRWPNATAYQRYVNIITFRR